MSATTPQATSDGVGAREITAVRLEPTEWGNAAPLALAAFAVTTFMLSMVNANWISPLVEPIVFAVALMFGGLTQLICGVIQFRNGSTFTGMLFGAYGAFWLSLFAIAQFFITVIPLTQRGHALGLFLYAFGIFTFVMWVASFRTSVVTNVALFVLMLTFFLLAIGNYGHHVTVVHWGGYMGLITAALADTWPAPRCARRHTVGACCRSGR